jgi:hypothetical protein
MSLGSHLRSDAAPYSTIMEPSTTPLSRHQMFEYFEVAWNLFRTGSTVSEILSNYSGCNISYISLGITEICISNIHQSWVSMLICNPLVCNRLYNPGELWQWILQLQSSQMFCGQSRMYEHFRGVCYLHLHFCHEDGDSVFLWIIHASVPYSLVSQPRICGLAASGHSSL